MLYTRASFIKWLIDVKDCEAKPIRDTNVMILHNGSASSRMWMHPSGTIDYEEIVMHCNKLWIDGLPGDKDLIKA